MKTRTMQTSAVGICLVVLLAWSEAFTPVPQGSVQQHQHQRQVGTDGVCSRSASGFVASRSSLSFVTLRMSDESEDDGDSTTDEEGLNLAADFFKIARERKIELSDDDIVDDDEDDDDDDEGDGDNLDEDDGGAEVEMELPTEAEATEEMERVRRASSSRESEDLKEQSAGAERGSFPGAEEGDGGADGTAMAGSGGNEGGGTLDETTDKGDELKYIDMQRRWRLAENDTYKPPQKVPDPDLTAAQVVELVCQALAHNDEPTPNKGIEIFFAYSSETSQVKQMGDLSHDTYKEFLMDNKEYHALFSNEGVFIEKGDYSPDGMKAYFTARLQTKKNEFTAVNFILSTSNEQTWMIDSMLIRPSSMRRRRR